MAIPRIHSELIKAWADGAEIEFLDNEKQWVPIDQPCWAPRLTYRIREKSYPKTTMTDQQLINVWDSQPKGMWPDGLRLVANEAIKRYIQENE